MARRAKKVCEDHKAEDDVEHLYPPEFLREGRGDDEKHDYDVEGQQPVAKAVGGERVRLIPIAKPNSEAARSSVIAPFRTKPPLPAPPWYARDLLLPCQLLP